MLIANKND